MFFLPDCPDCYNLVQQQVNILRRKINELRTIIENINKNPQAFNDTDFRRKLALVNDSVVRLWQDAKRFTGNKTFRFLSVKKNIILHNPSCKTVTFYENAIKKESCSVE